MTSRKKRKSLARIFADHRRIARTASPVLITSTARSLCFTTTHSTLTPQTEQYSESIFPNIRKTSEVLPSSRVANRFACFRGCTHTPPRVGPPSCSLIDSPGRWVSGRQRPTFSWGDPNPLARVGSARQDLTRATRNTNTHEPPKRPLSRPLFVLGHES